MTLRGASASLLACALTLLIGLGVLPSAPASAAPPAPAAAAASTVRPLALSATQQIASGVTFNTFSASDGRGGYIGKVVTVDLANPRIQVDHAWSGTSTRRVAPSQLAPSAAAIINGDFFDIHGTGATRGAGVNRRVGIVNGVESGWNNAFFVTRGSAYGIGPLDFQASLPQFPSAPVSAFNAPTVAPNSIGVFSSTWGAQVTLAR